MSPSPEVVTVATFQFLPEAEAVKLRFEEAGITSFLTDKELVAMDWLLANAIGNIKLQVPSTQAEAATALLEQIYRERQQHEESEANVYF